MLYLFAGPARKSSLKSALQALCEKANMSLAMEEWDILRTEEHDLSNPAVVQPLLRRIEAGDFDAIFMSPPCNTWSRAPHSNPWGPKPVRNKANPRGFPWAEGKFKELAELGNVLVDVCFTICALRCKIKVIMLWEHPEDLGASIDIHGRKVFPASIWQLPEFFKLLKLGWSTVAFFQCQFGVDRLKPTRLLANFSAVESLGFSGPPVMDALDMYMGPLPATCSHGGHPPLIKRKRSEPFHTTGTATYPPAMDQALAQVILQQTLAIRSSRGDANSQGIQGVTPPDGIQGVTPPDGSRTGVTPGPGQEVPPPEGSQGVTPLDEKEGHGLGGSPGVTPPDTEGGKRGEELDPPTWIPEECWVTQQKETDGRKGLLKAFYKGKSRAVHDGLGLCSMGRQGCKFRKHRPSRLASQLKEIFWRSLDSWLEEKGKQFELKLISSLLCGKVEEQPFEGLPELVKESWGKVLKDWGKEAGPRKGDRRSAVDLRLLRTIAEEMGDPDSDYLGEMAGTGVRLGAESEVPRIPEVYEEKVKWPLPAASEVSWSEEQVRDNYKSAAEHLDKVQVQVDKDIAAGHVVKVPLAEARQRYGSRLKIASLGAVPKDVDWSEVRVVHDATHGVEVNHQIRLCNRMRFPLFDDLEAVMGQFIQEAEPNRLAMCYDFKGAHRLVPIHPDDWGLQAFRLGDEEEVYLNCVGTFGVASAAFWWSRLAATLQRTMWKFLDFKEVLYGLLYADDGLFLAAGPRYKRNLLAVLLFLTVLGAPLSWRKTRGGQRTEWLGYTIDIRKGLIGISEKKVAWLDTWITQVLKEGEVLGRDMRAALGRMGFLAGPLKHTRPFLALVYRWTARLGPGAWVKVPLGVRLVMEFFRNGVVSTPLRPPRGMPRVGGEVFRVDAKADKGTVSIGGWETYSGVDPSKARWFALELNRSNAPWAFVKGEPYKVIASLELLAITVAVMVFAPDSLWQGTAGRLCMTAFTDNQANSYVLDKFMSTAFPLSVVLMELAVQLRCYSLDLDLQWIPREQNCQADSLTNFEFQEFSKDNRLLVEMKDLKFKILDKLMQSAASVEEEVILKKASKEKDPHRSTADKLRLTQPW